MYTWGIKDSHKRWSGSLAKRRLCLGPTGVINCTPLKKKKMFVRALGRTDKRSMQTTLFLQINFYWNVVALQGFPGGSDGKESTCNAGDPGLVLSLGRSPGEGNGYPFQETAMDRGGLQSLELQRVGHNCTHTQLLYNVLLVSTAQ